MSLKKYHLIFFLFLVSFSPCNSQNVYTNYIHDYHIYDSDTNKLFLQIDNNNFIKNNEYFGTVVDGYTLLGFNLTPRLVYFPSSKVKLTAGGNFLSYDGRENELKTSLLISFQYKVNKHFDFILGNIYGTVNHRLIDPLFDFERYLKNNIENGVQFLWNSDRIFADLWLDWEQQIFQGDPFHEKFIVGLSTEFLIFQKENKYKVSVPFQNLFRHVGGQINSNHDEPLKTIFDNATGLRFTQFVNSKFIHKIELSSYLVNYQDLSPTKQQMYIDGTGSYTNLKLTNSHFDLMAGYWYGKQFIAPIGNPIYESYSRTKFFIEEPIRKILIGKLYYSKKVYSGINLSLGTEGYYDLFHNNLEYNWSFLVVINEKFFLKKF